MHPMVYEHTDIPPGMTCDEYRRSATCRTSRLHHPRLPRLRRRVKARAETDSAAAV